MGERSLTDLGRHVADLQDEAPEAQLDRERGRARLLEMGATPPNPRSRLLAVEVPEVAPRPRAERSAFAHRTWLLAPLAAALALAALAIVFVRRPHDPMRFEMGATQPGVVGAWIAAPAGADLPIRFSDGSLLHLAAGGRARVAAVDEDGAEVALERGSLDLSVVHGARTRWTVRVGPFQVKVIGTRFETRWDPVTEQFVVALHEGAITVSGPVVGEGRAVRAGERLTVSPAAGTLEVGSIPTASREPVAAPDLPAPPPSPPSPTATVPPATPPSPPSPAPPAGVPPSPSVPAQPAPPEHAQAEPPAAHVDRDGRDPQPPGSADPSAAPAVEAPAPPSWRALALDARYKEALAAAEREGFEAICGSASAADLRVLGDAARLGGSTARAQQAFSMLRSRFPGSGEAATAAFILGRIAQDQSGNPAGAASWFSRYLAEQPGGPFAADALGRLMEAADKQGDAAGARRAAERYLASYPNGSHAVYAQRVLARGAAPAP